MGTPHPSLGMGKSPGRFGAPRGPRQLWERFPGRRCYFGRVKQEGEGCRGKFNVPPAGPAPVQAGMKTIRGERAAELSVRGPAPTGTGGTRGTRTGARRSPRGQDGVSRLKAAPPPPSRPLPKDHLASGWCLGLDHPCPRTGQGSAGEGLCGGPRASVSPGIWSAGSGVGQPPLSGKGSALDKRCRERRPLVLPPPHRSQASPPAASFRRRLSRLLSQHETPLTPGGATGRLPSRRGCPAAAQRLPFLSPSSAGDFLIPFPWELPHPPTAGDPSPLPTETLIFHPLRAFSAPLSHGEFPTCVSSPRCLLPAFL